MSETRPRLPPDYHSHTELCRHARGRPMDYVRVAERKQTAGLACTDHCPTPDGYDIEHRMRMDQFGQYRTWVQEAHAAGACHVLFGVEADFYPGCEGHLHSWLQEQAFDVVLGSVHYLDYWAFDDPAQRNLWDSVDLHGVWRKYCELVSALVDTGLYDVAAHLDLPKKFGNQLPEKQLRELVLPVLDRIAARGMAIEINTSGWMKDVRECYPSPIVLEWACEREIPLSFGSDAHDPERVGADFDRALVLVRQAGYTHSVRYRRRSYELVPLPE